MRDDLLAAFQFVRKEKSGWSARCPAHDDQRSSLSIGRGAGGRWLLRCHAGCELEAILAAAHLEHADLFPDRPIEPDEPDERGVIAEYNYPDERNQLQFQVVRMAPKDFRQRRPNGQGGWVWNLNGTRRVLFKLPELYGRRTVFIPEGEKDCLRLWLAGLPATCNAGGAGKWRDDYTAQLKAASCQHVVILPDNDPPGETHGRTVARSCFDAGLEVKLIPLPGLPPKGDVSDYLAHHSKDELLAIVQNAPLFDPRQRVTAPAPIELTSLSDLLSEPDDQVDYIVDDCCPVGAVVLFVGAPKTGKSTLVRQLSLDVSRGDTFLGWRTTHGTVWLLLFQDKRSEVKKHFRRIGATGAEPIRFFINSPPSDLLLRLHELAEKEHPSLIVVDMLAGLLNVKDMNDYAQVTQRFEPLLKLSRATGATLLLLHHGSAHTAREGLDAVLGSTALSGSVDNVLILRRVDGQRVLSSVQRIGPDLEPTIIVLNPETGRLERAGTKRTLDDVELGERILTALRAETEPVSESCIQEHVEGRNADKVRVLRRLLGMGKVQRLGAGGRKDPYRYTLESSCSRDLGTTPHEALGREPQSTPANIDLFATSEVLVPMFPIRVPEQENKNPVRTSVRPASSYDPCSLVPEVPDHLENTLNSAPIITKTPDKQASDSCSQQCEIGTVPIGANVERF